MAEHTENFLHRPCAGGCAAESAGKGGDWAALWRTWTAEALCWQLGGAEKNAAPAAEHVPSADAAEKAADRVVRALLRGGWAACMVLGAEAAFLRRLRAMLPPALPVLAVETDMSYARLCAEAAPELPLLAESSPWALLCLTLGALPQPVLLCHAPAVARPRAAAEALELFRRLHAGAHMLEPHEQDFRPCAAAQATAERSGKEQQECRQCGTPQEAVWRGVVSGRQCLPCAGRQTGTAAGSQPAPCGEAPALSLADISVGCILHPEEPRLAEFLQHIPAQVREIGVVWDGAAPSGMPPLRQLVRPLAGDFAAQRNAMLTLLSGRWVLYLDADERLSPQDWARLPALLARMEAQKLDGLLMPRRTYEGEAGRVRMGFGLWPDVQLRLFRRTPDVHFTGAVHERLEGLRGGVALAPDVALRHFSHIWKTAAQLAERLKVFDATGAGPQHQLNSHYPALPEAFFDALAARQAGGLWTVGVR